MSNYVTKPIILDETGQAIVTAIEAHTQAIRDMGSPAIIGLSVDGQTITYVKADGTSGTITTQDTTYTLDSFGITATADELNYVDGVTSNIQTQLNSKLATNEVANSAGKVPRYSADGHLVLPSGVELW